MSEEGLLQAYNSPVAQDLPAQFKGKDWAGVGTRARVAMHSITIPSSLDKAPFRRLSVSGNTMTLSAPMGISNPQFGTASDWATALSGRLGQKKTLQFFRDLKEKKVRVLPGNGDVARAVADGQLENGVTDSDDFLAQLARGKNGFTTNANTASGNAVLVPGAVSILKDSPNPQGAKKLFDAIASAQNETALIKQMPGVFSLRRLKDKSKWQSGGIDFSFMKNAPRDDYAKWPATWRQIREPLNQIFSS
jgi:iron(III) transport system substrate-binding protein